MDALRNESRHAAQIDMIQIEQLVMRGSRKFISILIRVESTRSTWRDSYAVDKRGSDSKKQDHYQFFPVSKCADVFARHLSVRFHQISDMIDCEISS